MTGARNHKLKNEQAAEAFVSNLAETFNSPPNYQVQRPHADLSARGRAATSRAGGSAARGRALYGDAARCNA
jgi:hypothetical protein